MTATNMTTMTPNIKRKMKDSGIPWIGMIPEEWGKDKVLRVFSLIGSGTTPKGEGYYADSEATQKTPWINSGDLNFGEISSVSKYVTPKALDEVSALKVYPKGSIIIAMYGASIGKIAISRIEGCTNQACQVLYDPNGNNLKYLFYQLYSFKDRWVELSFGGTQPNINADNIKQTWLALPTIDEQEAIASWLDEKCGEIDELIEVEQKMVEELEAYRQALITETVTRGLNPDASMRQTDISWIPEIPQHWEMCRLKDVFVLSTGSTPKDFDNINDDSFIDWVTPGDISDSGNVIYEATRKLAVKVIKEANIELFPSGSILYVAIGATAGKVGYAMIDCYSNQQITALISKSAISKFFYYYLNLYKNVIRDNAFFTTLPIINNSYLGNISIPLPPIAEQQAIADYLDTKCKEIDELIAVKRKKIETLKQYRQSIIFEAVTGKICIE